MKQVYYIAAVVVLVIAALGIFSSWAQNSSADNPAEGVLIIEEQGTAVVPVQNAVSSQTNDAVQNRNNTTGEGFQPLPGNPGVEVEPAPGNRNNGNNTVPAADNSGNAGEGMVWIEESVATSSSNSN